MSDSDDNLPILEFVKKRKSQSEMLDSIAKLGKVVKLKRYASTENSLYRDSMSFEPLKCSISTTKAENFIVVKDSENGETAVTVLIVAKNAEEKHIGTIYLFYFHSFNCINKLLN